jgi:hypothetical protein
MLCFPTYICETVRYSLELRRNSRSGDGAPQASGETAWGEDGYDAINALHLRQNTQDGFMCYGNTYLSGKTVYAV